MAIVIDFILALLLAGLLMPAVMLLPDSIRGEWTVIPVVVLAFGLVFVMRRRKS